MADYTNFELTLSSDEAFQLINAAINDSNKVAKTLLLRININYDTLARENEELKDKNKALEIENEDLMDKVSELEEENTSRLDDLFFQ